MPGLDDDILRQEALPEPPTDAVLPEIGQGPQMEHLELGTSPKRLELVKQWDCEEVKSIIRMSHIINNTINTVCTHHRQHALDR